MVKGLGYVLGICWSFLRWFDVDFDLFYLSTGWVWMDSSKDPKEKTSLCQDIQAAIAAANAEYDQKKVIVQNLASGSAPTFADDVELKEMYSRC